LRPTRHRGRTPNPCRSRIQCHYRANRVIPPASSGYQWEDTGIDPPLTERLGGTAGNIDKDVDVGAFLEYLAYTEVTHYFEHNLYI
jgi:hypothetical protein